MTDIVGSSGADTLRGGVDPDSLSGLGGGDSLIGLDGPDTLYGGAGADTLFGDNSGNDFGPSVTGSDLLYGGDANDIVFGGSGTDTFYGGAGDDVLISTAGAIYGGVPQYPFYGDSSGDIFDGGAGNDRAVLVFYDQPGSVALDLSGSATTHNIFVSGVAAGRLTSVEQIEVHAGSGNDTITGGAEADALTGGYGDDVLTGGAGDDSLSGEQGSNTIYGGAGDDRVTISFGNDTIFGGDGNDSVFIDRYGESNFIVFDNSDPTLNNEVKVGGQVVDVISGVESIGFSAGSGADSLVGGAGSDTFYGSDGDDTLRGGGGDDSLLGGAGHNLLDGGAGQDSAAYFGANGPVTVDLRITGEQEVAPGEYDKLVSIEDLYGSSYSDTLIGDGAANGITDSSGASDRLYGNGGDDILKLVRLGFSDSSAVAAYGGDGDDTVSFGRFGGYAGGSMDGLTATLDGGGGADVLAVEGAASAVLYGGDGGDRLEISSRTGLWTATLGAGADTVHLHGDGFPPGGVITDFQAGAGGDVLDLRDLSGFGGANPFANDLALLQVGADVQLQVKSPFGDFGQAVVTLQSVNLADLTAYNFAGYDVFTTGTFIADSLQGGAATDRLSGLDGADTIVGAGGNDIVYGGKDEDFVVGGQGDDQLYGGDGNDAITNGDAVSTQIVYTTYPFYHLIVPDLTKGGGNDVIDGGAGVDEAWLNYTDRTAPIVFDNSHAGQVNTITVGGVAAGSVTGVEVIDVFAGSGNDSITVGAVPNPDVSSNFLSGGAGDDTLTGGASADLFDGGPGDDLITGGGGNDVVQYSSASAGVVVDLSITGPQNTVGAGIDTLIAIKDVVGGDFGDRLTGNSGDDQLQGGAGDDTLNGGGGPDTLLGGVGDDTYLVYSAQAKVVEFFGEGQDVVHTTLSKYTLPANVEALHYDGAGAFNGTGSYGADALYADAATAATLHGGAGDDTLYGGLGNDSLYGEAGADTLYGGAGNDYFRTLTGEGPDVIFGGDGSDLLTIERSDATQDLKVDLSLTTEQALGEGSLFQGIEQIRVAGGLGNDSFAGGALDDVLKGNGGADTLSGGGGSDVLQGGAGHDSLTGGDGGDTFRLDGPVAGSDDVFTDFVSGTDHVALSKAGFGIADLSAFDIVAGSAGPSEAKATLIVDTSAHTLSWDADGTGSGSAVLLAHGAFTTDPGDYLLF